MSIAFFDVDETLITGKSMFLFLHRYAEEYPLQCGLTAAAIVRQLQALSEAGQPREAINRYYYSLFRHESRPRVRAVAERLYREGGYGFHHEVVARLRQHQARGDDVVFVSGSMTDILWPAMAALGVEHALCSEPVVVDDSYTGELWRTAIGEHKATHAQCYAQKQGQPLAACYAFGDHISDLPLLTVVGHPCAVNPCPGLLAEAQRRGWPVLWSTVG
ncbi:HAD-IB family hydrolase [Klebsiella quasipneumoniae subsp. similipneumoniae]|uniref:HAD family hydrolase n=1 Tax=Klebsiella quasipneumoniae TaxID=1463165 RepID=UPI001FB6F42C|nr:HAD-IB family hydrolase [Klebsiella quasipneumoniae]MCJ1845147.1 HAD-IB family hydrolase [Klebsiella quasipneumoniae subsp. similipneumoniae]HBR1220394.1 HAD-IB family hydrolase [Klebsiella quasipneumoniae subsp. similipneumoniae]